MRVAEQDSGMEADREARKQLQRARAQQKQQLLKEKRKKQTEERAERHKQKQKDMCQFHSSDGSWLADIPEAPTFTPTAEEFADPIGYIRKIQGQAAQWGICKINPPVTPAVPGGMLLNNQEGKRFTFTTRLQYVKDAPWEEFDEGKFFQAGKRYTLSEYERYAEDFCRKRFGSAALLPSRLVEAEYWREMATNNSTMVEYGNDVVGSAFGDNSHDPLAKTGWNLQVLPKDQASVLRLLKGDVPGVTSPMLYIGMLFATFAWHVEDHYLYSINYQHMGAQKIWYGVPGSDALAFESVAAQTVYQQALSKESADGATAAELRKLVESTLLGKTTMFSPRLLHHNGVRVCRAVQGAGEFIITFPRSYHAGFGCGFNVGEAVNFAIGDWFPFGMDSCKRYCRLARLPVMPSEELLVLEALTLQQHEERGEPGSDLAAGNTVKQCFVDLMKAQHQKRALLHSRGAGVACMPALSSSFPCALCRDMAYLAAVAKAGVDDPRCLTCALAERGEQAAGCTVLLRSNLPALEQLARTFEVQLAQCAAVRSSLGTAGVNEQDDRAYGTLDLTGFAWQPLPVPAHSLVAAGQELEFLEDEEYLESLIAGPSRAVQAAQRAAEEEEATRQQQRELYQNQEQQQSIQQPGVLSGPGQDMGDVSKLFAAIGQMQPGQLPITAAAMRQMQLLQQAAAAQQQRQQPPQQLWTAALAQQQQPEAAAAPGSWSAGAWEELHDPWGAALRDVPSESDDPVSPAEHLPRLGAPGPVYPARAAAPTYEPPASPELPAAFAGALDAPAVAADGVAGKKRGVSLKALSGFHQPSNQQRSTAAAPGADGRPPQGQVQQDVSPGTAARLTRGSLSAGLAPVELAPAPKEAPARKKSKKAPAPKPGQQPLPIVNIAWWTLLNTPSDPLVCVSETMVAVNSQSTRRRVFAASEDPAAPRYVLGADFVRGCGVTTNTSASNIIERWFRDVGARCAAAGLPAPQLPSRAYCQGVNAHGTNGTYVINAQDVIAIAFVLPGNQRARAQQYTMGVFPEDRNPVASAQLMLEKAGQFMEHAQSSQYGDSQQQEPEAAAADGCQGPPLHAADPEAAAFSGQPMTAHAVYHYLLKVKHTITNEEFAERLSAVREQGRRESEHADQVLGGRPCPQGGWGAGVMTPMMHAGLQAPPASAPDALAHLPARPAGSHNNLAATGSGDSTQEQQALGAHAGLGGGECSNLDGEVTWESGAPRCSSGQLPCSYQQLRQQPAGGGLRQPSPLPGWGESPPAVPVQQQQQVAPIDWW